MDNNTPPEIKKPPIGLVPRWVIKRERFEQVKEAIGRYYEAGLKIPVEWIIEYNDFLDTKF